MVHLFYIHQNKTSEENSNGYISNLSHTFARRRIRGEPLRRLEVYLDLASGECLDFLLEEPQEYGFIHIYLDDRELWLRLEQIASIFAEENLGKLRYHTLDGWELTFQMPLNSREMPYFFSLMAEYEGYLRNQGYF